MWPCIPLPTKWPEGQNQSHYETDVNDKMKRGWTFLLRADHKVIWGIWYKRKEHTDIGLKCEMKSTKL